MHPKHNIDGELGLQGWTEDLISAEQAGTLDGLFVQRVSRSSDREAYRAYERATKTWVSYSWSEMGKWVARWQDALSKEDLHPGDRVALVLRNCPEWVVFDQACLGMGLVVVPLYTDDRPDNIGYILQDADVKLLLVQDAGRWKRLAPVIEGNETLKRVVISDPGKESETLAAADPRLREVDDWLPDEGGDLRQRKGDPHQLASIVYTSGTTGRPKGVMLSHYNMLSVSHAGLTAIDVFLEDIFLSFLPLSHTLERTAGYYIPMMTGSTVAYSRSVAQLADDLLQVQPTVLIAVPRIFERVYGRIKDQMSKRPFLARWLLELAVSVGWQCFLNEQKRSGWKPKQLLWPLMDKLVANKIKARLGGRLRAALSGGAPLSPEIAKVFIGLGVPILQGYGLTETSPQISVNLFERNDPASVGPPLRGIDVKIGEQDELLVKSPGVMLGYWNNHAATAKMIDSDGWLHTGDCARIKDGYIYITGRIKDILVLSNGEKVPPGDLEQAIGLNPLFEQVMVIGEGQPFLGALIVLSGDLWPGLAQEHGLDPMDHASLQNPKLVATIMKAIRAALHDFPGFAKIRRVRLMLEPWTIDNGMLTPTLKVKRAKVIEHYMADVAKMYQDGPGANDKR